MKAQFTNDNCTLIQVTGATCAQEALDAAEELVTEYDPAYGVEFNPTEEDGIYYFRVSNEV